MPEVDPDKYKKIAKFDSTLIENMTLLSKMDNYYRWIGQIMRDFSGNRILEIGCANGNLTSQFLNRELVMGSDYSSDYIKQFNERFKGKKNVKSVLLDITDRNKIKSLKKYKFDTIITMNTFEHIKNDKIAFQNTYSLLEKNGKFIIFVPAGMWLYSILDYEGGHFRRYIKNELTYKVQGAGFKIDKIFYINMAGALGWYFSHVIFKKRIYSPLSFKAFNSLVPIFKFFEGKINPPFGLSLVCIARKN